MAMKKMRMVVVVILALMTIANPAVKAAITCQDAITKLLPCEQYLVGNGGITAPCCESAEALNQMASSTADRQAVCACFKQVGPSLGVHVDRAKQLPTLCKIDIGGIPIDYTVDCTKIKV